MRFFQRRNDQGKIETIRGLLTQSAEAFERGKIDESAEFATHARSLAEDLGRAGDQLRCSALSSMAAVATRRGEIEHAQISLDAATDIITANRWQYTSRHYWVMINSAVLDWTRGDKDAAKSILLHAYQELASRGNFKGMDEIHLRLLENMCGFFSGNRRTCGCDSVDHGGASTDASYGGQISAAVGQGLLFTSKSGSGVRQGRNDPWQFDRGSGTY
jgi:hypothetical protein